MRSPSAPAPWPGFTLTLRLIWGAVLHSALVSSQSPALPLWSLPSINHLTSASDVCRSTSWEPSCCPYWRLRTAYFQSVSGKDFTKSWARIEKSSDSFLREKMTLSPLSCCCLLLGGSFTKWWLPLGLYGNLWLMQVSKHCIFFKISKDLKNKKISVLKKLNKNVYSHWKYTCY